MHQKTEMWDANKPLSELPLNIRQIFLEEAEFLKGDLLENRLSVELFLAPEPRDETHMIRVAVAHNPKWYSDLYHSTSNFRRDRAINALSSIINERDNQFIETCRGCVKTRYSFQTNLRNLIFERLTKGYDIYKENFHYYSVSPDSKVCKYFEIEIDQDEIEKIIAKKIMIEENELKGLPLLKKPREKKEIKDYQFTS